MTDAELVERIWRRDASVWTGTDEAAWLGIARDGTTMEEALPGSGHADGFADLAATMPGAGRPRDDGHPGTGPNGAGPGPAHADEEDTL